MIKRILALNFALILFLPSPAINANSHAKSLSNLKMNDVMFAQMMIPHHQQAIDMSLMAIKNGASAEIKILAKEIISSQNQEMSQMKYWLKAKNAANSMGHDMGHGMSMDGMLSDKQVKSLQMLKGSKFDKSFLESMIAHHQGALEMVDMLRGTTNSEAKKLAKEIVSEQKAEIKYMKKLLSKISQ